MWVTHGETWDSDMAGETRTQSGRDRDAEAETSKMNARDMDSGSDTKIETDQNTNRDGDGKRDSRKQNCWGCGARGRNLHQAGVGVRVGPSLGPSSSGQDGIGG